MTDRTVPHFFLPRLALFALLLALPTAAAADEDADKWPVERGPSREPLPYHHDPAVLKKLPKEYLEDYAACTLYYATSHLVEADGTVETITHEVTRLNGRKGVERLGEYRAITYDPAYQKLTLHAARVIKPNGKVVPIEPRHVQLRDVSTDYQVYDHEKQLIISFPNLEVGDTIEVKWTTRGRSPEFGEYFFTRYNFGDDQAPLVREEVRVRLPKDMPFKYAAVNGKLDPTVRDDGKERLYVWRSDNRPPLPQDSDLPSKETLRLGISVSTYPTWEAVGKWKAKLRADCWKCTDAIREVVREVTKDLKTPLEKARALATWVRRRIRYVSVASARHGYTPNQPNVVLGNLFGDCKDQTQLLAVMLREAGLLVYLVTLGAQDDGQVLPELPSPWGTHAILLVPIDGEDHWIDTTATHVAWDFLPAESRDRVVYVTDEKGKLRLLRTPPLSCQQNAYEQTTLVQVRPDGTSFSRRQLTFKGLAAASRRGTWIEAPVGERRRLMAAVLQDSNSRTRLLGLSVSERVLRDVERPVSAEVEFEIPGQFSGPLEKEGSLSDSNVWGRVLAYTLDHDRRVALDLGRPFESVHRYVVQLPHAYVFDGTPSSQFVPSKWGSFRATVKPDPADTRRLEVTFHTRLEKTRVEPADFDDFRRFHEDVTKHWRVWLNLAPTQNAADAPLLETWLLWSPGDRVTAAVLARLYVDGDRKADARRVLLQARLFHPDDLRLWDLTVKAAPDTHAERAAYRAMVRRFPGETKFALALGEACVRLGDLAAARAVLEPLTAKGPASVRGAAHYRLARSWMEAKEPAQALKHLDAARAADAESVATAAAQRFRGEVLEQLRQPKEAIEAYRRALKLDADYADALGALVRLELAAGARDEALRDLRRYTVLVGDDRAGLVRAAAWHLQLGRQEDAFDLATRAQEQKFDAGAQRVLGLVHLQRGQYERAVFHLDRAERDEQVLLGLIRGYLALGKVRTAIEAGEAAAALRDCGEELKQARAQTAALAERRKALLQVPPEKAAVWAVAVDAFLAAEVCHRGDGPRARAEQLLAGAFGAGVDLGPAYALRGLLALERGRLGKALGDAERATALSPGEARGFFVRGRVRLERLDKAALADLTRAAELSGGKDGVILHWLAAAQFQAGDRQRALETQRAAVKLRPRDAELAEQLREYERAAVGAQSGKSAASP
jgi:tetratricopeptide (TPR) repeat protein/transglutaminase-like putative cysteine protease